MVMSAYERNGFGRALSPPGNRLPPKLGASFLFGHLDSFPYQRVEQNHMEADGLQVRPAAGVQVRAIHVLRIAHIGALHEKVQHAFLRRTRDGKEHVILDGRAGGVHQLNRKIVAVPG